MEINVRPNGATWRWSLLISVVFLNICVPSLILTYGVLWVHLANLEVPLWIGFCTPTIFLLTFGLTQCWFREAADSWGGFYGYRVMAAIGLTIVVASLLICAFVPLYLQSIIYGIFGGLGSSLISAQVDAVIFETYDSRLGIIRGICYTCQAVGQSLFPHIMTVLINNYGYSFSFIIFGGIILQAMPAVLLLKIDQTLRKSTLSAGLGSSLISAQVDAVIFETYDSRLGIIRGICYTCQAVGQSLFPHIMTVLINNYGYSFSFIIFGGIILQAMPAVLLLKIDQTLRKSTLSAGHSGLYKSYSGFQNDGMDNYYTAELQLNDLSKKCWKSPSDDNLNREGEIIHENAEVIGTITPPPSPEEKRRNIFGVDILPDIPEESEESEEDDQVVYDKETVNNQRRLSIAIKRLSTLGDNLDEYIVKKTKANVNEDNSAHDSREYSELEVTYDNISPITDIQTEKVFNSFSFRCQTTFTSIKRRLWIPSYRMYRIKRRFLYAMYSINDTFVKPLTRSLSCWRFYPALLLTFARLSLSAVSLTLLPMIAHQVRPKIAMFETNFLMSLHGFTWICFLLSTPWLAQTPKRNFKYVIVVGLIITTAACFVFAEATSHDSFAIGCVISGLGYGAVTSCCETAVQDFVGARKWPKLHSTLETLSASLLAFFVVGLSFVVGQEGGYHYSMFIMGIVMSMITIVWLVLAAIALYDSKLRYFNSSRRWLL